MARDRKQRRLGESLEGMLSSLDAGGWGYAKARVSAAWESAAGELIASHTTGAFLRGDELVIYVDSPVWAHELQAMSEDFRVAINNEIGQESVSTLRFIVSKNVARDVARRQEEETQKENPDPVELRDLSTEEIASIELESEGMLDDGVREAFLRARIAASRRKRSS